MAQLLLLSLLVVSIQQSSGQVVVSSSSNEPGPVPLPASPADALSPAEVSPATHSPLDGKDGEGLPGVDGSVGHRAGDEAFGDEEISDVEVPAALPKKETQVQGNSSITDLKDTEETSQDSDVSSSPADPKNIPISTTIPSLLHPASSVSGMGQTQIPSASTVGLPVTVDQKRSNATQEATPLPSANTSSDHTRFPNSTVREEVVTSGQAGWRPDRKAEEEYQQLAGSKNSTITLTTPGEGRAYVQPQGQTTSDADSAIATKAPTSPAPTRVPQPLPSTPSPGTRSPGLQSTTNMVPTNSTITQPIVSIHRAGKDEMSVHSTPKLQQAGGPTTTVTPVTPLRTTLNTTRLQAKTEQTSSPALKIGERLEEESVQRNTSGPLGHPSSFGPASTPAPSPREPCVSGLGPCVAWAGPNGTALLWGDLHHTLSFAWELHVYGTAGLFLLLAAGALLGLLLSPGLRCPHRGCLALANGLLLLVGALRAAHFFIDPYGSREVLPHPGVAALYNPPLAMLVWAQAALALLSLRGAGLVLLPPGLQRLPLVAVLAVLHCTVLLGADLMSPALSPAVLVVLQTLSLSWGLGLCLGFFFYAFPHLRRPPPPPAAEEPVSRVEGWQEGQRTGRVLGRVLAVCACLGALCCGLHVHATLWLYGLLGDWRRFSWAWWLVHFWARLLELAWAFSLLLLASWVFWRPRGRRGDPGLVEGRIGADLPSSSSSSASMQRHTCWAKIVQSLRGRPCRKSESNGVGGGGSGELPNNWAGQERPGADISKSLIRNREPPAPSRSVKDSNRARNQKAGASSGSAGSLLRLHSLGQPPQRSLSSSLDRAKEWALEKESVLSLNDFDLRPPSPIDLSRSIDEALHREHLLRGGSLFRPLALPSPPSPGPRHLPLSSWPRRSSDPHINLSDSSSNLSPRHTGRTELAAPLGGSVASRQVTAPATPTDLSGRLAADSSSSVPSSVSCPTSFRPSRTPVPLLITAGEDTEPFMAAEAPVPDVEKGAGSSSFLEVSRQEDSTSVSSDIIDL
ncbi:proline-rich transmembrane protein 3 [Conger conger]|uniref:proline-rich transmembrane protein 3 n=1 Tax=Conger conger TaxID=82655 RepID=UPI002A5B00A3|nr:proline-rich transmembrane protein 3 [Conger conger]XP_061113853.1 proline-rich transmembrane protein 3 [Conger conger]XP_061113854.1 proline-rich transmembrane protein 3 [Conger conger]